MKDFIILTINIGGTFEAGNTISRTSGETKRPLGGTKKPSA
jgi:hypothetical protein